MKEIATGVIKRVFVEEVVKMNKDFEEDKVTQEIDGGIASENISETLQGGEAPDNLYSFIGFEAGEHPTDEIRKRLDPSNRDGPKMGQVVKQPDINQPTYAALVNPPNLEAIYEHTPMPWGPGMSWAEKIETGIQGFAQFLPSFKRESSRSRGGIQVQGDVRPGAEYTPPSQGYLTRIVKNFENEIIRRAVGGRR